MTVVATRAEPVWRRGLTVLAALAVIAAGTAFLAQARAGASGPCWSPSSKAIAGTVQGEDGRYVSSQVGIELFDAQAQKIRMDGCAMPEAGYSISANTNLKSSCCYLLPADGSVGPTYGGVTLSKAWSVTGLPANAVTAWIEVYPKKCCVAAGVSSTDDSRYGRALRRPLTLPNTNVAVKLPLRCGQSGNGVSGTTGALSGRVFDNGVLVASSRVGAWSQDTDTGSKILGWSLKDSTGSAYTVDALAPGVYSVITDANAYESHVYNVSVLACHTTNLDVAVRGVVPPPAPPVDLPVPGDWNGDGADEPGTFTPGGTWRLRSGTGPTDPVSATFTYGVYSGDIPVVGDWDGDGKDDVGVYRKGGTWYLRSSVTGTTASTLTYGVMPGDIPVVGDWDGDGIADIGVYRVGGTWHLRSSATGLTLPVITYGVMAGDRPVVGDWDGDGRDEPGIFRVGGTWFLRSSTALATVTRPVFTYGIDPQDLPIVGDWTGDTTDSVGVYRRGTWYLRSGTGLTDTTATTVGFGS